MESTGAQRAISIEHIFLNLEMRRPPLCAEFVEPTPPYTCEGGTTAGSEYPAKADCLRYCEEEGGGVCQDARLYVSLGSTLTFTVKAANRQPGTQVSLRASMV